MNRRQKSSQSFYRPAIPVVVGLCLGITVSIIYAPFIEEGCANPPLNQHISDMETRDSPPVNPEHQDNSMSEGNFEPRLKLQAKPMLQEKIKAKPKKLVRPRYISTELGIREKILVAVLSAKDTIDSFGVAMNKTLSQYVTKTIFFLSNRGDSFPSGMSIVSFANKHPQLLPIHVLKYVAEHYLNTYDYYMFVSDRAYLRGEKIFDLVSHISISEEIHLGAQLNEADDKHCMLEGGVIIAQSVLAKSFAEFDWCTKNSLMNDPSENFGRCIIHGSGIPCSEDFASRHYSNYKLNDFDFDDDISGLQQLVTFNRSISVFPMPDDISHYKMHRYFCQLELNHTHIEIEKTKENIIYMSQFAPGGKESLSWPIGLAEPTQPKSRFDVIRWEYFTETHIYFDTDYTNIKEVKGVNKLDIQEVIAFSITQLQKRYKDRYSYVRLVNGYRRFEPNRGMEYTLDLALKDSSDGNQEIVKRVHLVRPLGHVEIVPMPYVTENTRVNLILPVTLEDRDEVGSFLDSYAHTCLDSGDNTNLFIVFISNSSTPVGSSDDSFSVLKSMINYYDNKYQNVARISWMSLVVTDQYVSEFALMDAVSKKFNAEALLLTCSVGMELATEYFNRVRMNTIAGWQAFFPIGFWQYKPNLIYDEKPYPTTIEITRNVGHFDTNSFEHSSFYNSDYMAARKLMSPNEEKTDIFSMFIKHKMIHVFRAIEPALKHRYKLFVCNAAAPKSVFERCETRRAEGLASRPQLAMLIFEYQQKVDKMHRNVMKQQKDPNVEPMKPNK